jgi:hypothetical protein
VILCGVSIERNTAMIQVVGDELIVHATADVLIIAAQIVPPMICCMVQPSLRPFGTMIVIQTRQPWIHLLVVPGLILVARGVTLVVLGVAQMAALMGVAGNGRRMASC